jgi:hypothetical protein
MVASPPHTSPQVLFDSLHLSRSLSNLSGLGQEETNKKEERKGREKGKEKKNKKNNRKGRAWYVKEEKVV